MLMYEQISRNLRRSRILVACFLVIISALGYFFGAASGFGWLGFILALFIAVATSWFGYYYSDEVALSASHAKPLTKADNLYLYNLIE